MECGRCKKNKSNIYNGQHWRKDGKTYNVCDECADFINKCKKDDTGDFALCDLDMENDDLI